MRTSAPRIPSMRLARERRRTSARWSIGLVAILALSLGGCGSTPVTPSPSTAPPPSSSVTQPLATPAQTVPPSPTVAAAATPAPVVGREWQVITLPAAIPDGDLSAVAVDDRGWIAVGRRGAAGVLVLESPDGLAWSEIDRPLFSIGDVSSVSVAVGPPGRMVAAAGATETMVWHAGPDGTWKKITFPRANVSDVLALTWGAGRYLADGVVSPGTPGAHSGFWQSSDGTTWHAITSGPPSGGGLTHIAADFLLAGGVPSSGGTSWSAVFSSPDGTAWSKPKRLPEGDTAAASQVSGGPGGIVIWSDPPGGVTWTSASGTMWSKEVVTLSNDAVFAVAPVGTGFVLSGRATSGDSDVFANRASLSAPWQAATTPPDLGNSLVTALVGAPDGSLVVGVGNSGGGRPVIVVSPPR